MGIVPYAIANSCEQIQAIKLGNSFNLQSSSRRPTDNPKPLM